MSCNYFYIIQTTNENGFHSLQITMVFGWILVFFMYNNLNHLHLEYNTIILFKRKSNLT